MSVVTGVIVSWFPWEEDPATDPILSAINGVLRDGEDFQLVDEHAGGWKAVECRVAMAGVNHLDHDALLAAARSAAIAAEAVWLQVMFYHDQSDDGWDIALQWPAVDRLMEADTKAARQWWKTLLTPSLRAQVAPLGTPNPNAWWWNLTAEDQVHIWSNHIEENGVIVRLEPDP